MASNNLDDFIKDFNGGNRTHRYDVEMNFPTGVGADSETDLNKFFIRAVSLPAIFHPVLMILRTI